MSWRLPADFETVSLELAPLGLCAARLMDDSRFVWIVLIPRRDGAVEIEDLSTLDQVALLAEAVGAGRRVRRIGEALNRPVEKLNIAQLGNVTRQLHVHVIGRRSDDAAWPKPVWGAGEAAPWKDAEIQKIRNIWSAD
jgi:diadenosine tetraphosphate (Ap4A) HIT family hydrolase